MPGINWGQLAPLQQMNPIATVTPQAQAAPNPLAGGSGGGGDGGGLGGLLSGIGGLLGGGGGSGGGSGGLLGGALSNMFGSNPVSATNQALTQAIQSTPPQAISQSLLGGVGQPGQATIAAPIQAPNVLNARTGMSSPQQGYQANPSSQGTDNQLSVSNVQQMAQQVFPNDPVRQQLAVAQATHESNLLGKPSGLATNQNNIYGMTGSGNAGSKSMTGNLDTTAQQFASYKSPMDSMLAYKQTLQNPRYKDAMTATNFTDAANAVAKGGYATDPKYAQNLIAANDKIQNNPSQQGNPVGPRPVDDILNPQHQVNAIHEATQAAARPGASPMDVAQSYMGMGRGNHADTLQGFFNKSMGQNVNIQNTPWCAAFANSVLMNTGHGGTGSLSARSFLNYGTPTSNPTKGDVAVFKDLTGRNDPAHGHVGFYAGPGDKPGYVKILGGNQSGAVNVHEYPESKLLGYRIPPTAGELQQKGSGHSFGGSQQPIGTQPQLAQQTQQQSQQQNQGQQKPQSQQSQGSQQNSAAQQIQSKQLGNQNPLPTTPWLQ